MILNLPDFQSFPTLFELAVPHFVVYWAADFTGAAPVSILLKPLGISQHTQ